MKSDNSRHMRRRRVELISFIPIILVLGFFVTAWGKGQGEEEVTYKEQVESKLEVLNKEIDELKNKSAGLKDEAKAEFNKEMNELQKKQRAVKEQLMKVQHTTKTQWQKVKSAMDGAAQDLKNAYDNLVSRFKERKIED